MRRAWKIFYDFAVTPAVRLIPSYQHIWNPFVAQVATEEDHAEVFLTRLTVSAAERHQILARAGALAC